MSDSPRDDLTELVRAFATHVAWQRDLGASVFPFDGALPLARPSIIPAPPEAAVAQAQALHQTLIEAPAPAPTPAAPPRVLGPPPVAVIMPTPAARPSSVGPLRSLLGDEPSAPRIGGPTLEGEARIAALRVIQDEVAGCTACRLAERRHHTVFARGSAFARLCFVGEGPGEQEDKQGLPFVGAAGQLLDKIIGAMGVERDEVYVCNVVKCRPPNNRQPEPDEMKACTHFLVRQLNLVRPEVIVALGRTAVGYLLDTKESMTQLRGKWKSYQGIPVLPTWHPAYLLRTPEAKADTWSDMKLVMARLGLQAPAPTKR